jgi:raffinose/stachyose/melibiose transport system permease protein
MHNKKFIKVRDITLFLLPALLLFVGVLIAPILMSGYYSLFDWNGMGDRTFVGFANYKELFTSIDINFLLALRNSLLLAVLSVFLQLPLSLALALALGKGIKGERLFLSVFFAPVLISTVVIGQLWLKIYNPDYGLLNSLLRALNLEDNIMRWTGDTKDVLWLGNIKIALGAVFVPTLWQYVGYHMLLMYAGVKGVPIDLREAAMLDGASSGQVNRYIVLPYIKPIIKISIIFAVTGSLKSFDLIYVLTNGGPLHSTEVPSTLMISMMFLRNRYGMGSTIAVMLIILCFAFALLIGAAFRKED